jgi:glycosyltransferase involved in cell wall biosynthesis
MAKAKSPDMKILFFIDGLIAGGKERRLLELMKGLKAQPDITFELAIMNKEIHYREVFNLGIKIHFVIRKSKKDLSVFGKLYRICKDFKPDVLHCWDSMTAVIAVLVCSILKIKLINGMVVNTPVKQDIFDKEWLRAQLTFPFSSMVVGNSNAGLRAYNAPKRKSLCIYNGLDFGRFKNLKDAERIYKEIFGDEVKKNFIVGMVAAFEKRKDYKTLIQAALQMISENYDIRFVLIGNGVDFDLMKEIVPAAFSDKIIFLGKRNDIEDIVNIFDVGILLTNTKIHGEGISNSIMEYMASGKPVIATRGGGTNEIVINQVNGYLIDPDSADQLIEKIKILMEDQHLMQELGEKGRELAHEKFDLKIMTREYTTLYHKITK